MAKPEKTQTAPIPTHLSVVFKTAMGNPYTLELYDAGKAYNIEITGWLKSQLDANLASPVVVPAEIDSPVTL